MVCAVLCCIGVCVWFSRIWLWTHVYSTLLLIHCTLLSLSLVFVIYYCTAIFMWFNHNIDKFLRSKVLLTSTCMEISLFFDIFQRFSERGFCDFSFICFWYWNLLQSTIHFFLCAVAGAGAGAGAAAVVVDAWLLICITIFIIVIDEFFFSLVC